MKQEEIIKSLLYLSPSDSDISTWQEGFLKSVLEQVKKGFTLSHNQERILSEVCAQNTPERLQSIQDWKTSYSASEYKQESFRVCAHYYNTVGYFTTIVENFFTKKDYVPSEKEYKRLCDNKYAKRVLESHFSEPLYPKGTVVQLRKGHRVNQDNKLLMTLNRERLSPAADYAVVLESDAQPIHRAAKGSKIYKILPVGVSKSYYVHESDLKRARGIKK